MTDFWEQEQIRKREKKRERALHAKRNREELSKHGIIERLRQYGVEDLPRDAQLRVLRLVGVERARVKQDDWIRQANGGRPRRPSSRPRQDPRIQAVMRLARDPGATDGERAAALAAAERMKNSARRTS